MGDKPLIHIESKVTTASSRADAVDGALGQWSSASRVMRGPGRWSRLMGMVAVIGLLAGGLLWWTSDSDADDDGGDQPYCGIAGDRVRAARIAFFEAGLTRDIAVDARGRAVETVASGPNLWTRSASTVQGLAGDTWVFRTSTGPLGPTAVLHLVLSARDPREKAPDAAGRCVIRATVPPADSRGLHGEMMVGANVLLTLDEDRNIARIVVRSAPEDPEPVVELDIAHVGKSRAIAPPHSDR